jgi:hypothetical protein
MAMIPMQLAQAGVDDNGVLWPVDELIKIADRFQDWQRKKPDHRFPVRAGLAPDGPIVGVVADMSFFPSSDTLQVTVDTSIAVRSVCNGCGQVTIAPVPNCPSCGGEVTAHSYMDEANNLMQSGRLVCFIHYDEEHLSKYMEYKNISLVRIGTIVQMS